MRTFINFTLIALFYTFFILMCCNEKWQHSYVGKVNSKIECEIILKQTEGHYMKYSFSYIDKYGNVRTSDQIKSYHPSYTGKNGYCMPVNSWVEKQLLEKHEVWKVGWNPWYIIAFVIYSITVFVYTIFFVFIIVCRINKIFEDNAISVCERCAIPGIFCPLNIYKVQEDRKYFKKLNKERLKRFFGYEQ